MTKKLDILSSGICLLERIHLDVRANGQICKKKRGGQADQLKMNRNKNESRQAGETIPSWVGCVFSQSRRWCFLSPGAIYAGQNGEKTCSRFLPSK